MPTLTFTVEEAIKALQSHYPEDYTVVIIGTNNATGTIPNKDITRIVGSANIIVSAEELEMFSYAAQDKDGDVYLYTDAPIINNGAWYPTPKHTGECLPATRVFNTIDPDPNAWRYSLTRLK